MTIDGKNEDEVGSSTPQGEETPEALRARIRELEEQLQIAENEIAQFDTDFAYTTELAAAAFYSNAQLASVSELETGRFLDVNETWVKTRGYSREEAIGKTADELRIWESPEFRAKIVHELEIHGRLRNYEVQATMRNGDLRNFILNAEVLDITGQKLLFFSGMDITDRKREERNLQRSQKMDAVGQLTGGIAHDFNNLLAIIQGNLELLGEQLPEDEKLKKLLQSALHGTERGVSITKKLLSFSSRHNAGHITADINELILEMKDLISKSLTASVDIKLELADDLAQTELDPGEFEDAIINLCLNAHDAMPDGGNLLIRTFNAFLSSEYCARHMNATPGPNVSVEITDTGIGMSEETRDRIFEPFFTTKEHGKGTGLGLSMVFGFVNRSRGHIAVETSPGKGTCFTLYFPQAASKSSSIDIEKVQTPPQKNQPTGNEKILVVDDEVHLADLAKDKLGSLGFDVLTATNACDAYKLLQANPDIELLFTDIVMPGPMNGFQLAINCQKDFPNVRILLTSGYTKSHELLTAEQEKEIANLLKTMLFKPYTMSKMSQAVRNALDGFSTPLY